MGFSKSSKLINTWKLNKCNALEMKKAKKNREVWILQFEGLWSIHVIVFVCLQSVLIL